MTDRKFFYLMHFMMFALAIVAFVAGYQSHKAESKEAMRGQTASDVAAMLQRCESNLPRDQQCGLTAIPIPIKDYTKY